MCNGLCLSRFRVLQLFAEEGLLDIDHHLWDSSDYTPVTFWFKHAVRFRAPFVGAAAVLLFLLVRILIKIELGPNLV